MSAQVVENAAVAESYVHFGVFQRTDAVVCVAVGDDDVFSGMFGTAEQPRVQLVAVEAADRVIGVRKVIVKGRVIPLRLPFHRLVERLAAAGHDKGRKPQGKNQPQQRKDKRDGNRDDGVFHMESLLSF